MTTRRSGPRRGPIGAWSWTTRPGSPCRRPRSIILWQRLDDQIQGLRRLSGAREVFTNEHGAVRPRRGERGGPLPPQDIRPAHRGLPPGVRAVAESAAALPPGVAAGGSPRQGLRRLTPVTDYEDRAEAFNTFVAMLSAAQLFPPTELPETSELIRFELESLGG